MKSQTRHFFRGLLTAGVVLVMLAASASAQSPANQNNPQPPQPPEATVEPAPQPPSPLAPPPPAQLRQPYWSAVAGFEADTHDTGYGFAGPTYVRPIRPNLSFVAGGSVNYLYYRYPLSDGHTSVTSPGMSVRGGVQFGDKNYFQVMAGPSVKRRHTEMIDASTGNVVRSLNETLVGLHMGASVWVDPTKHNNIFGMLDYNTQDNYTWSRLAYKEQLANHDWGGRFTPYVGVEAIGQGNDDIRSAQVGAFVEVVHVPSTVSVMLRGGYKRSTFDVGPARTGPWFAVGFYQRLR